MNGYIVDVEVDIVDDDDDDDVEVEMLKVEQPQIGGQIYLHVTVMWRQVSASGINNFSTLRGVIIR